MATETAETETFDKLVTHALTGNSSSLGEIQAQLQGRLWAYLRARGASADDADDAVQETWIKVTKTINDGRFKPQGAPGASFRGYVFRIAANELTNLHRKRRGETELPEHHDESTPSPQLLQHQQQKIDDQLSLMRRCIDKLTQKAKSVILLRSRMSRKEVSAKLEIPGGTVDSTYSRAKAEVRDCMGRQSEKQS